MDKKKLFSQVQHQVNQALEQLNDFNIAGRSHSKLEYVQRSITKIFKSKFHLQFTRSKILINFLPEVLAGNTDSPYFNSNFVTHFCTTIELLHIAAELHSLIESPIKNNTTFNISNEQIILFGDLLFTMAFEQILLLEHSEASNHFATTTQQIAEYECSLSNFEDLENSNECYEKVLAAVMRKYWPLFKSIVFFYKFFIPTPNIDILISEIQTHHQKYVLNKLIQARVLVNSNLHSFIYSTACQKYFENLADKTYHDQLIIDI